MKRYIKPIYIVILILLIFVLTCKCIRENYEYPDQDYKYAIVRDLPFGAAKVTPGYEFDTPGLGWIL